MATYTDNYQLTKPTYAEQADIGVINSNMNKIDEIMHSSQISLAPAYDQSQTYAEGDVVMYELLIYKCISPTTGAWDASKWERTTASESGGGGSAELDILGEASGAVASFADGASAELAKCIADVNPKQDLHGYDKPWAGGAGKNKLPLIISDIKSLNNGGTWSGNIYTINGMTFEIIADDNNILGIKANGTPSAHTFFGISGTYGANSYIFNGCPSGGANNTYRCDLRENIGGAAIVSGIDTGSGFSFTLSESKTGVYNIRIESGYDANNIVFYPMIRLSTEPSGFEPYSNICPISGSTSVTVTVSDGETSTTKTTPLGQTVYGGQLNVTKGELEETWGYIASYNGETLPSEWISDRDEYEQGTTPTIGAEVAYKLATPQTVQLTPQEVNSLLGQNNISADTGDVDIVYVKASAPIQPNPTGTPTATLKKLGIEGTVFEVEGGGGGSSSEIHYSTTEKVVGTVEMNNGTIKPLYEKSWWLTIPSQSGGYIFPNTAMADLDQVISNEYSFDGKGMRSYTYWYTGASIVFDEHTSSGISFYFGSGDYGGRMIFYTARYTKITN